MNRLWIHLLAGLVFALFGAGQAQANAGDGRDHPLLSRMPGYVVHEKTVHNFDAVELKDVGIIGHIDGQKVPLRLEGKVTEIKYLNDAQTTSNLEVYRNYAAAIRQAGGQQLNSGFEQTSSGVAFSNHVFRLPSRDGGAPMHVLLHIHSPQWYSLTFVEPKVMEQSVKSGQIAEQIKKTGMATLHINFDTAKAELKDDGRAAVQEIAAVLKGDPSLKLSIEGHTDNVGQPADNKKLSLARADAVMRAVVAQGIDAKRLSAKGYGQEKPVADNTAEAGRAQNRRVELVKVK